MNLGNLKREPTTGFEYQNDESRGTNDEKRNVCLLDRHFTHVEGSEA